MSSPMNWKNPESNDLRKLGRNTEFAWTQTALQSIDEFLDTAPMHVISRIKSGEAPCNCSPEIMTQHSQQTV